MISEHVVSFYEARPFRPFEFRLQGGFVVPVPHPEFMALEFAVLSVTVYDDDGRREVIDTEKIVSLRTLEPVETL